MKVIVLNRKRLGVTLVIIGLMVIMLALEKQFDSKLKYMALMNSNMNVLKEYKALGDKFTYKLPEKWTTSMKSFPGEEIIYHNDYVSEDMKIHGFVEVWNLKEDLKSFLDKSKAVSLKENKVSSYKISHTNINKREAYVVNYIIKTPPDKTYVAYEYFIKLKDRFIRFSFFVDEKNFKETMPTIFKALVETFTYVE